MSSFRQISTESHRERNYSVVVLCGFFCATHLYYLLCRKARHINLKKDKVNKGRNIQGQPKRGKTKNGVTDTEFEKRKETLYQRKKTPLNKVTEI